MNTLNFGTALKNVETLLYVQLCYSLSLEAEEKNREREKTEYVLLSNTQTHCTPLEWLKWILVYQVNPSSLIILWSLV